MGFVLLASSSCTLDTEIPALPSDIPQAIITTINVPGNPGTGELSLSNGHLYVGTWSGFVYSIDLSSYTLSSSIEVHSAEEVQICIPESSSSIYTGCIDVFIIDGTVDTVSVVIDLPSELNVYGVAYSASRDMLYASCLWSDAVIVIDAESYALLDTIDVGCKPQEVLLNDINNCLYVLNVTDHTISVIDTESNNVVDLIQVGMYPTDLCLSQDGNRLYVACGSKEIYEIQSSTHEILRVINTEVSPTDICILPPGDYIYLVSMTEATNGLQIISIESGDTVGIVSTPAKGPCGVVANAQGTELYVMNYHTRSIDVYQ